MLGHTNSITGESQSIADATIANLTASKPVFSDANKKLVSTGTQPVDQGGTGQTAYAVGDLIYASTTGVLSKLPDVAVGSVLVSGGVNTAPAYASSVGIGIAPVAGTRLTLPLEDEQLTPTLAFGDGDTGFFESFDDILRISLAGSQYWAITSTVLGSGSGGGGVFLQTGSSTTVPSVIPNSTYSNTGLGSAAADQLSLIAGAIEGIRVSEAANLIDVSVFGNLTRKYTVTTDNTNGADTYTAAEMLGGLILRGVDDAITGAVIDVTATAAAIVAAIPGCIVGSGFEFRVSNRDATHTVSVDGGAGVTMSPNDPSTAIPAGSTGTFLARVTNATAASEAATIHCLGIVGH